MLSVAAVNRLRLAPLLDDRFHESCHEWGFIFRCKLLYIPGSPHNPKFPWVDDAKIVGNRIAEVRPVPGNRFAQETKRRIGELGASCTAFVARDVSVHDAP
jgi:hypothetical protein